MSKLDILAVAALLVVGCSEQQPARSAAEAGSVVDAASRDLGPLEAGGPDGGVASVLGPDHAGWKEPRCETCHKLPEMGHAADRPPQCAACHGGNGACPPNASAKTDHSPALDCLSCHQQQHGFSQPGDCAACHFAAAGQASCAASPDRGLLADAGPATDSSTLPVDSGGKPPVLSTSVQSACFNWPSQPFSPANKAPWTTSVKPGQQAIELALKDTSGASHTLSQLLASRPVWLQFGSFT